METDYKNNCIKLVEKLETEISKITYDSNTKQSALKTITDFLEIDKSKIEGAAVALKFNAFVLEFGRYLLPGGIQLSKQASQTWSEIIELFNSSKTRGRIQPFSPFRK